MRLNSVTTQLICAFVLAYAKSRFSHDAAHMMGMTVTLCILFQFDELPKALAEECTFIFIRLNVLREYLEKELQMNGLPFEYDFEVTFRNFICWSIRKIDAGNFQPPFGYRSVCLEKIGTFCSKLVVFTI